MFERSGPVLKIICLGLAALVFYQFARLVTRKNPLERVTIPAAVSAAARSNSVAPAKATNSTAQQDPGMKQANVPPSAQGPNMMNRMMPPGGRPEAGPPLPPAIQARIERITQSEILAPVMRPLPMALLGIAGRDAFLRAPNGQTGLVREGDELGGVKLLAIGTNRVLIEHEGQKKELTVFSGFGSETLLSKEKENPR